MCMRVVVLANVRGLQSEKIEYGWMDPKKYK